MKILITAPINSTYNRYFPDDLSEKLREFGEVIRNPYERSFTESEMKEYLADTDIVLTHWGTPQITGEVLSCSPKLRLIAHAAGSVAHIASNAVFDRNIPVISANSVMARFVAESVLGYMIAGSHRFVQTDKILRNGGWNKLEDAQHSVINAEIGLIGLGTVGRILLDFLRPFNCKVFVFDPYISDDALSEWEFAEKCGFETAMSRPIVSVHASKTPETYHMIDEKALSLLPFGALFINSSRGSLVDTAALIKKLREKKIYAVLDVYEKEGAGNIPEELLDETACTLLQPHTAAIAVSRQMTEAVIEDIVRFLRGERLINEVSRAQFNLMTQE